MRASHRTHEFQPVSPWARWKVQVVARLISLLLLLLIVEAGLGRLSSAAAAGPWGEGYFPNSTVRTQDGRSLRFYDDVIKGKIVVISFIYTSCTDFCPLITARMAEVAGRLGDAVGRDFHFVSITVDPEHDTSDKLKAYADAFHAGKGWLFLTGALGDIRAINARLGEQMRSLSEHRTEIVLGNDATGDWMRNSLFGDIERVLVDIRAMDPRWQKAPQSAASDPEEAQLLQSGGVRGQMLYKRLCSSCHTIKMGNRVGPDLYGVTTRRKRDWLIAYVSNAAALRAQRDPVALALAAEYGAVRMPRLGLGPNDADDLLDYIAAQSARLDAGQSGAPPATHGSDPAGQHHHHGHRH